MNVTIVQQPNTLEINALGVQGPPGPQGDPGENAPEVNIQYSQDSSSWHETFSIGDKYIRFSTDGGSTWTSAMNFIDDTQIAKSIGTTKGDLIGFSGSATPVRVAVGADGKVLKANSAQASGLEWGNAGVDSDEITKFLWLMG